MDPRAPLRRQHQWLQVLSHPVPPAVHQRGQRGERRADLRQSVGTCRQWMAMGSRCDGLHCRMELACPLRRGLGHGVRTAKGMPGQ